MSLSALKTIWEQPLPENKARKVYTVVRARLRWYRKCYIEPAVCKFSVGRVVVRWYRERSMDDSVDVFLLSFPKCGRTWLRLMLGNVFALHFGLEDVNLLGIKQMVAVCPSIPLISIIHDDLPQWKAPNELLANKTEYEGKKVILLVRDPRDVVVSNYFQKTKRRMVYKGDLSSFLRCKRGSVDTLIRFYNIWAENKHVPSDFLLVRYEDMHADAEKELRRVLDFLGLREVGNDIVREATEFARFENMRKMEMRNTLASGRLRPGNKNDPESYKTRRGKVGGFVDYLSEADVEYLNQKINTELSSYYGYTVEEND